MKRFLLMLQFFTRIPINKALDIKKDDFSKGIVYFPVVGLIVGGLTSLVYYISSLFFQDFVSFIMVLLTSTLLTGGLHLDGLADTCDGLFSARNKERMLEIMRDSCIGTNGALGMIFILGLKVAFLLSVSKELLLPAIVLMPVIGRTTMAVVMYKGKYAREGEGLGNLFIGKTSLSSTIITLFLGIISAYILLSYTGVLAFVLCILLGFYLRYIFSLKLGGLTGDLLGAINETTETFFLLALVLVENLWGYL